MMEVKPLAKVNMSSKLLMASLAHDVGASTAGVPTSYSTTAQLRDYPQWSSPLMVSANRPTPRHDDTDSNKYRRKSPLEGITRWFRYCFSVM